jgi:hypothetical protein
MVSENAGFVGAVLGGYATEIEADVPAVPGRQVGAVADAAGRCPT